MKSNAIKVIMCMYFVWGISSQDLYGLGVSLKAGEAFCIHKNSYAAYHDCTNLNGNLVHLNLVECEDASATIKCPSVVMPENPERIYSNLLAAGCNQLVSHVKVMREGKEIDRSPHRELEMYVQGVSGIIGDTINRCDWTIFKGNTVPDDPRLDCDGKPNPEVLRYEYDVISLDDKTVNINLLPPGLNANNEWEVKADPNSGSGKVRVKAILGPCWVGMIAQVNGKKPPDSDEDGGCGKGSSCGSGERGSPIKTGPIFHTDEGANVNLSLGRRTNGQSAGDIRVSAQNLSEASGLTTDVEVVFLNVALIHTDQDVLGYRYPYGRPINDDDLERFPTNAGLLYRQILTSDYLIDFVNDPPPGQPAAPQSSFRSFFDWILPSSAESEEEESANPTGYTINYYKRECFNFATPTQFVLKAESPIYDSYHFMIDKQGETGTYQIVRNMNERVTTNAFVWTEDDGMELHLANNTRIETVSTQTNGDLKIISKSVRDGKTGKLDFKKVSYIKSFVWGDETIKQVTDPDGAALTTTRSYYDDADETGKWKKVQMEVEPDGSWTRYDYYMNGYPSVIVRSWKDLPTNTAASLAQATYYSYESVNPPNDDGSIQASAARTTTETIEGQVVSKFYYSCYLDAQSNQVEISERCATPSSVFGNPANIRTTSIKYPYGLGTAPSDGKIKQSTSSDGRMVSYQYDRGAFSPDVDPADPAFTAAGSNDIRTIVTHGTASSPPGIAGRTTREISVVNEYGQTVYQGSYVYSSSGYERISGSINWYDDVGHLTNSVHSDGSSAEAIWTCCGKDSETDAQGIEHAYSYDDLNRRVSSTKLGTGGANVATYTTYDAVGRVLTTRTTGGELSLMTSNAYDLAGRLTNAVDAAGRVTSSTYEEDGRKVTVTLPGGATQTTEKYRDGQTKAIYGTAGIAQTHDYGVNADGSRWSSVHSGSAGAGSPVWTTNTTDMLGRSIKQERSGYGGAPITTISTYNHLGQLTNSSTTGEPPIFYEYNELGEQSRSAVDVNGNNQIDTDGTDRITETVSYFEKIGSDWWQVSGTVIYPETGSSRTMTNGLQRTRLTGLGTDGVNGVLAAETKSLDLLGNETVSSRHVDRDKKFVISLVNVPDSTVDARTVTSNGLMIASRSKTDKETIFIYDGLERQVGVVDPRVGTSLTVFNDKGQVCQSVDTRGSSTWYAYDPDTGRQISTSNALGNTTFMDYDLQGHVIKTWGSATYPVSYDFDEFGRMTVMTTYRGGSGWDQTTWPGSPGTGDSTTWAYDPASGLLTSKVYSDTNGTAYTYSPDGKLLSRTWARTSSGNPLVTTYGYDFAGNMTNVNYSDVTPGVRYSYTRLGQQAVIADGSGTRQFQYGNNLQATSEVFIAGGMGGSHVVFRTYDGLGRPSGIALDSGYYAQYSYDTFGRFVGILASPTPSVTNAVTYQYLANADLWEYQHITNMTRNIGMTVHKQYNANGNLIDKIEASIAGSYKMGYNYTNDALGRRSGMDMDADNSSFTDLAVPLVDETGGYRYNTRSEVTGLTRGHTTPLSTSAGMTSQWDYAFDNIGNRTEATHAGRVSHYTANQLNQYNQRTVPGEFTVYGVAETGATVTVNNGRAVRLQEVENGTQGTIQKFWRKDLTVTNTSAAVYQPINVVGVYNPPGTNQDVVTASSGNVFVAETPEGFVYDADGNLTRDGRWDYSWDGENRLVRAETRADLPASVPLIRVDYGYDCMSRRVWKKTYTWNSETNNWLLSTENFFVYDGWNLIAETINSTTNNSSTNLYIWGLDLSSSLQGAGGIGGLLTAVFGGDPEPVEGWYTSDANGNVSDLVDSQSGAIAAHYEYSPFGEIVIQAGDDRILAANPYAFSTKYSDRETGLVYYGHRFYNPALGRWMSRDPIGERGGVNYYAFNFNNSFRYMDILGLASFDGRSDRAGFSYRLSVGECEIAIFYGHGAPGAPHDINFEDGKCSKGVFFGCGEDDTNIRIPDDRRLFPDDPGESGTRDHTDILNSAMAARNNALSAASEICNKCTCNSVSIQYVFVPHNTLRGRFRDWWLGFGGLDQPVTGANGRQWTGNETVDCGRK